MSPFTGALLFIRRITLALFLVYFRFGDYQFVPWMHCGSTQKSPNFSFSFYKVGLKGSKRLSYKLRIHPFHYFLKIYCVVQKISTTSLIELGISKLTDQKFTCSRFPIDAKLKLCMIIKVAPGPPAVPKFQKQSPDSRQQHH